jgi:hypothetical protein
MRFLNLTLAAMIATASAASAREFGGYECSDNCSGHAAGYRWAQARGITSDANCPLRGRAVSFYEGCLVYTQDPDRGADQDDDGDDIED